MSEKSKTIGGCLKNNEGKLIPNTTRSTMSACEEHCEKEILGWERLKEMGYRVVQVEIREI